MNGYELGIQCSGLVREKGRNTNKKKQTRDRRTQIITERATATLINYRTIYHPEPSINFRTANTTEKRNAKTSSTTVTVGKLWGDTSVHVTHTHTHTDVHVPSFQ